MTDRLLANEPTVNVVAFAKALGDADRLKTVDDALALFIDPGVFQDVYVLWQSLGRPQAQTETVTDAKGQPQLADSDAFVEFVKRVDAPVVEAEEAGETDEEKVAEATQTDGEKGTADTETAAKGGKAKGTAKTSS